MARFRADLAERPAARAVGIFVKDPRPGRVKTRLGRVIGMAAAAEIYRAFAGDVVEEICRLREASVTVFYDPPDGREGCHAIVVEATAAADGVALSPQRGAGLGSRMAAAFESMFETASRVVLVGTDLPTLTCERVEDALRRLEHSEVVFGPALDGGYYLIGLRRGPRLKRTLSQLFENVPWSSEGVLAISTERLAGDGVSYDLLSSERDVDTVDDLHALVRSLLRAPDGRRPSRTRGVCGRLRSGLPRSSR